MKEPRKILIGFQEGTCQLRCKKCRAFSDMQVQRPKVEKMSMIKAKQLIDEIAHMENIPIVAPNIYSEPFTNPDMKEIVDYCANKGIRMSIITNGILMDDDMGSFLLKTLDRRSALSFSLDAVSQDVYEKVRGKYSLDKVENKIIRLLKNRKEHTGPRVTVSMTIEEENKHEQEAFINKWKYIADGVRVNVAFTLDRKIPEQFKKHNNTSQIVGGCADLRDMLINADGHARICCEDLFGETDFGDVFEKGIMEVWNNMEPWRQRICSGKLDKGDFCYGCEAGILTGMKEQETEDFIIKEADYWIFYNRKDTLN